MTALIGLDTNVALRWLFRFPGDEHQAAQAGAAVQAMSGAIYLNLAVLAELIWLSGHTFKLGRDAQADLIERLLDNPRVHLAERDNVARALASFRAGGAGYTDHLIAALNLAAGCKTTLTFDKTAAKADGFTLLP